MLKWKNIAKLTEQQEKSREAAFEAQMLAIVAAPSATPQAPRPSVTPTPSPRSSPRSEPGEQDEPTPISPSTTPPIYHATSPQPAATPTSDTVQISVTANGQTTHYPDLHAVPADLRQHILTTWLAAPTPISTTTTPPAAFPIPSCGTPSSLIIHPSSFPPSAPSSKPRSLRVAITLNLLFPGAGQFYLRQPRLGAAYAIPFLVTLIAILTIFLRGYHAYLTIATNGDLLDPGNLETLTHAFPVATLSTLSALGTILLLVSTIHLILSRPSQP